VLDVYTQAPTPAQQEAQRAVLSLVFSADARAVVEFRRDLLEYPCVTNSDGCKVLWKLLKEKKLWLQRPDVNQRLFCKEPNALASALIALKKCVLGPNGPRIKAKAVHEIVVSSLQGGGCT
jgi:hypothetical protein